MIVKYCESCGNKIIIKLQSRRFCNRACQLKKYFEDPNKKKERREYNKKYYNEPRNIERLKEWRKRYRQNPEVKEKNRILAITRYRERRRKYWKEYGKKRDVRLRIRENEKRRRKIDKKYAIIDRLRRSLNHALTKYSKTGKIMSSKRYGINWEKVINGLKPFPKKIEDYEIDHIKPLHSFNLNNTQEIKKAFDPSNLQWLTMEENRIKSGRMIVFSGGNKKSLISA